MTRSKAHHLPHPRASEDGGWSLDVSSGFGGLKLRMDETAKQLEAEHVTAKPMLLLGALSADMMRGVVVRKRRLNRRCAALAVPFGVALCRLGKFSLRFDFAQMSRAGAWYRLHDLQSLRS